MDSLADRLPVSSAGEDSLAVMEDAARLAGRVLREASGGEFRIDEKAPADFVTEIDLRCEEVLRDRLGSAFPDFGFLGEESGRSESASEWEWIVDPIDGTRNFIRGVTFFCVTVALTRGGIPVAGVVYDPVRDELFSAADGAGAKLNGGVIGVSGAASLDDCVVGLDLGKSAGVYRESYEVLGRMMPRFQSARLLGSQALALAYLAAGRIDLYFNLKSSPWDVAGAALLVREAGGLVTDLSGNPSPVPTDGVVAGNPTVHAQFVERIAWPAS